MKTITLMTIGCLAMVSCQQQQQVQTEKQTPVMVLPLKKKTIMKKLLFLGMAATVLNSCCYCTIYVPELYPIPEYPIEEVCDADATEVIPSDK